MNTVYAQAVNSASTTQSPLLSFVPFVLIFVVFYFLMIRPQQQKIKKEQEAVNAIKEGEEIYTRSGIIGTVRGLNDKFMTIEIATNVKIKVLKSQIAGLAKSITSSELEK